MANQEHVEQLRQGVPSWNQWRAQNGAIQPDLSSANLNGANLSGANLSSAHLTSAHLNDARLSYANLTSAHLNGAHLNGAHLNGAHLNSANLRGADLNSADLNGAHLTNADLRGASLNSADLRGADLNGADLSKADLSEANLNGARLINADLRDANLSSAHLSYANLSEAKLSYANLSEAKLSSTTVAKVDLCAVKGLATLKHYGPSHLELFSVQLPQDGSALHFLRGCGVPDEWIDDYRARMMHPIQYHSCFISYNSKDEALAKRLHADLQAEGVRCWFAPEDLKIGDKIRSRIDEAIHLQEKLLLLLSEHALASDWVETEVEAALDKEKSQHREVLFPVRLDESIMQTEQAWAKQLRRARHIGNFTHWTDPQAYQQALDRLLRDLKKVSSEPKKPTE